MVTAVVLCNSIIRRSSNSILRHPWELLYAFENHIGFPHRRKRYSKIDGTWIFFYTNIHVVCSSTSIKDLLNDQNPVRVLFFLKTRFEVVFLQRILRQLSNFRSRVFLYTRKRAKPLYLSARLMIPRHF